MLTLRQFAIFVTAIVVLFSQFGLVSGAGEGSRKTEELKAMQDSENVIILNR
jgi:hypothetical protein